MRWGGVVVMAAAATSDASFAFLHLLFGCSDAAALRLTDGPLLEVRRPALLLLLLLTRLVQQQRQHQQHEQQQQP